MQTSPSRNPSTAKTILTVSELNRQARITIEEHFQQVWVLGEMSNFARPRSGHWYFSLKDEKAQVRCAMFANRNRSVQMQPGEGQLVLARGRVSLYEGRGDFQIIVDHLEPAGEGALRQAFDQLKIKLAAEGLFSDARKTPLPSLPRHVAVVTSPTGAAIKDVISVWRRRFPALQVTLIPTAVQGEAAEGQLIRALERAAAVQPDVILLTRGGGSLEDLWSFNLESVARALAACPVPTVSAVGHEIDVTICDFVADMRAPTPSAAAELIAPDAAALQHQINTYRRQLNVLWQRHYEFLTLSVAHLKLQIPSPSHILERASQQLDDTQLRLTRSLSDTLRYHALNVVALRRQLHSLGPREQLKAATSQANTLGARLLRAQQQMLNRNDQQLQNLSRMLNSVSPLPTIARGFAVVTNDAGDAVTHIDQVVVGDTTTTFLSDGAIVSEVKEIQQGVKIDSRQ